MTSIHRRLIYSLTATLVVVMVVVSLSSYLTTRSEMDELFDENMKQVALTLQTQLQSQTLRNRILDAPPLTHEKILDEEEEFVVQVWDIKSEELLYTSHPSLVFPRLTKRGFHNTSFKDARWRSYVVQTAQSVIQISQPLDSRIDMLEEITLHMLLPILLLMPLLLPIHWWIVKRSLHPLSTVSKTIHTRNSTSLEPLTVEHIPEEIKTLVLSLNDLLDRLKKALHAQRRFIADAAHELRTPLTAIQLQADLLQRANDPVEHGEAIIKLKKGIARSSHLITQLLTLARQEPEASIVAFEKMNLVTLAKEVAEQYTPQANNKQIELHVQHSTEMVEIRGNQESLRILLSNLVDNAVRFTPRDGEVEISLSKQAGQVVLHVSDNGPGIPESERARVFDRFHRVQGTGVEGTGLGLAIVESIAKQHHASIDVGPGLYGRGITFGIHFPDAASFRAEPQPAGGNV